MQKILTVRRPRARNVVEGWETVMRLWWLLALVCLACNLPAVAAPTRWAVVVGVDQYQRPDVTPLRFAVADARAVARALQTQAGFLPDNIFLLSTDQTGDNLPTRSNLAFRLGWLAEHVQPGDTVFFFFSGHGIQMDELSYLMTCDADPRSATTLRLTGFSRSELQQLLGSLRAHDLLVVLDACRSDPRAGKGASDNRLSGKMAKDLVLQRKSQDAGAGWTATLLSCSEGERSYEWADRGHGFFTWFLLQALEGRAGGGTRLTWKALRQYLRTEVPKATMREMGQSQVPLVNVQTVATDAGSDAVVFSLGQAAPAAVDHTPQRPPVAAGPSVDARLAGRWTTDLNVNGQPTRFSMTITPDHRLEHAWLPPGRAAYPLRRGVVRQCSKGRIVVEYDWAAPQDHAAGTTETADCTFDGNDLLLWSNPAFEGGKVRWRRVR